MSQAEFLKKRPALPIKDTTVTSSVTADFPLILHPNSLSLNIIPPTYEKYENTYRLIDWPTGPLPLQSHRVGAPKPEPLRRAKNRTDRPNVVCNVSLSVTTYSLMTASWMPSPLFQCISPLFQMHVFLSYVRNVMPFWHYVVLKCSNILSKCCYHCNFGSVPRHNTNK